MPPPATLTLTLRADDLYWLLRIADESIRLKGLEVLMDEELAVLPPSVQARLERIRTAVLIAKGALLRATTEAP